MIVVSMTNCPPKLRGDLSKWLLEINTGVYVGQVSARVREALWKRICENVGGGQATMVFSTNNEQHFDFHVHNTSWRPADFDGIKLMKHPNAVPYKVNADSDAKTAMSMAAIQRMNKKRRRNGLLTSYVLLDIETTGLSCETDKILEIGYVEVGGGRIVSQQSILISVDKIPEEIIKLTGITPELATRDGSDLKSAIERVFEMIDDRNVLIYNAEFDLAFLKKGAKSCGIDFPDIHLLDVLELSKKMIKDAPNYKLGTIASLLGITNKQPHRALGDCLLMNEVYLKLNEK
ncbi:MAG TPA: type I-E CRISPR-associated endoribonuclease Cas2 [Ruminococcaceae bacterium]|nr:type I-E CRISPR-associated endoribonuclease Cas2 [Oscillospiraceae bacterium]